MFHGASLDPMVHDQTHQATTLTFADFDLFFTFLTSHDEVAPRIAAEAKPGAIFIGSTTGIGTRLSRRRGHSLRRGSSS